MQKKREDKMEICTNLIDPKKGFALMQFFGNPVTKIGVANLCDIFFFPTAYIDVDSGSARKSFWLIPSPPPLQLTSQNLHSNARIGWNPFWISVTIMIGNGPHELYFDYHFSRKYNSDYRGSPPYAHFGT